MPTGKEQDNKKKTRKPEEVLLSRKEFQELETKISNAQKRLSKLSAESNASANQGAAKREDNPEISQNSDQLINLSNDLNGLISLRNIAKIFEPPVDTKNVRLGHIVTVRDVVSKETIKYKIGSYNINTNLTDDNDSQDVLEATHASPIGTLLRGGKVGEKPSGNIGGIERTFEILNIE